jgi:Flp pilus assembly protein TadD
MKKSLAGAAQAQGLVSQMELEYQRNSIDLKLAFNLVGNYLAFQRSNDAFRILDDLVARPNADATTLLSVAKAYVELNQYARSEAALARRPSFGMTLPARRRPTGGRPRRLPR